MTWRWGKRSGRVPGLPGWWIPIPVATPPTVPFKKPPVFDAPLPDPAPDEEPQPDDRP